VSTASDEADDHLRGSLPLREHYRLTRAHLTAALSRAAEEGWAERRAGNSFFLANIQRMNRVRRLLSYRSMLDRTRNPQHCREH
jgi:hypothetical protein